MPGGVHNCPAKCAGLVVTSHRQYPWAASDCIVHKAAARAAAEKAVDRLVKATHIERRRIAAGRDQEDIAFASAIGDDVGRPELEHAPDDCRVAVVSIRSAER